MSAALSGRDDRLVQERARDPHSQLTCKMFSAERKTPWHSSRITACNALIATVQRRHGRTKSSESEKKNLRNAKPVA